MRIMIYMVLISLISSCQTPVYYTQNKIKNRDLTINEIMQRLGKPLLLSTDSLGNKIYIFKTNSYEKMPTPPQVGVNTSGPRVVILTQPAANPSTNIMNTCTITIVTNAANKILSTKTSGALCPNYLSGE